MARVYLQHELLLTSITITSQWAMASQITSIWIVYSDLCSGAHQRKHQSSVSLAFVRGIRRSPLDSRHKGPVAQRIFPFDDVITLHRFCVVGIKFYIIHHLTKANKHYHDVLSDRCVSNRRELDSMLKGLYRLSIKTSSMVCIIDPFWGESTGGLTKQGVSKTESFPCHHSVMVAPHKRKI